MRRNTFCAVASTFDSVYTARSLSQSSPAALASVRHV